MINLYNIFEEVILESNNVLSEQISDDVIRKAIDGKYRVNITYDDGKGGPTGKRNIEVYAMGDIKGYPTIRAFQLFGNTKTGTAVWKTFRVDRILSWEPTNFKFYNPVSDRDGSIPKYKEDGTDKTIGHNPSGEFNRGGKTDAHAEFDPKYRKK